MVKHTDRQIKKQSDRHRNRPTENGRDGQRRQIDIQADTLSYGQSHCSSGSDRDEPFLLDEYQYAQMSAQPFFQAQGPEGNHCGRNALNMFVGDYSEEFMVAAAEKFRVDCEAKDIPCTLEHHITSNGDYSAELLIYVGNLDYLTKLECEALIANPTGAYVIRPTRYHFMTQERFPVRSPVSGPRTSHNGGPGRSSA